MEGAFVPGRLTLIREARELSRRELAALVGVTPSAITQFENGDCEPSAATICALADALAVRREFFLFPLPGRLRAEDCHFRHQRAARAGEKRRVAAVGQLTIELIQRLEDYVTFPPVRIRQHRLPVYGAAEAIEGLAERLRLEWGLGLGPIANMVWLLEHLGVVVLELRGRDDRLDAFSGWSGERPVVFLTSDKSATRRRYDAAHELGHLVLHPNAVPGASALEAQADRFAGAFLLPRAQFMVECPRTLDWSRLLDLKERWSVSLAALVVRAHELGIYSDAQYRRSFMHLNKRGWRYSEPGEPPLERPALLAETARVLAGQGLDLRAILESNGLSPFDLIPLLEAAQARGHAPEDDDPRVVSFANHRARRSGGGARSTR